MQFTYDEYVEQLRDVWDESSRSFTWWKHPKYIEIRFHYSCGDGCCSWSENHSIDIREDDKLWQRFKEFFIAHPNGEEYAPKEDNE